MSKPYQNPFGQVAILLISITIIVGGTVYQKAFENLPLSSVTPLNLSNAEVIVASISPTPATTPQGQEEDAATADPSSSYDETITPSTSLSQLAESLVASLDAIRQFLSLVPPSSATIPFTSIDNEADTIAPVDEPTDLEEPTAPAPTSNLLNTIKKITGYSKWEEFKTNFRESQEKYAGTGECMINIRGFGCLVQW